tara:strand:+ start:17182 stop:18327 length:1146 start_codon:yes stop_codon:yes gene_type:complete
MKDQYVILTGSKNNAGDYLIKYRAKKLFSLIRPDRRIIDINGWEQLNLEQLTIINQSRALILMGGPALVENMVPKVYALTNNLNDIKVPIIMMGIGWKSQSGDWKDTYNYHLSKMTLSLLDRIESSGYYSSVRDYHTLSALRFNGFNNFLMTGCPAYYDEDFINTDFITEDINTVAFSLGVSFMRSPSMQELMKKNILACNEKFKDKSFTVIFHHALERDKFQADFRSLSRHIKQHNKFADWLEENDIKYVDISGSAENLINYYNTVDLHIGYRVHAHIFMNSINKKSILISEDGRAKGVGSVISGIVLDGYLAFREDLFSRVLNKILPFHDRFTANSNLTEELISEINYEYKTDFLRLKSSRKLIDNNYIFMQNFLKQLP